MASNPPNPNTLFHLVPTNQVAQDALLHPDNIHFVSTSREGLLGLEVGYHVSSMRQGLVITRLGRNADLILQESSLEKPMSRVHVAFEINYSTAVVILSVRSKQVSSVTFAVREDKKDVPGNENPIQRNVPEGDVTGEPITSGGVMAYTQDYDISIASYNFRLLWMKGSVGYFKTLLAQGYQASLQLLQDVRSRDRPTESDNSEALAWHVTRLDTVKGSHIKEAPGQRDYIKEGNFGVVYKTIDQASGYAFAVKEVKLRAYGDVDTARASIYREVKIMESLNHVSNAFPYHYLGVLTIHLGTYHRMSRSPRLSHPLSADLYAATKRHPDQSCPHHLC